MRRRMLAAVIGAGAVLAAVVLGLWLWPGIPRSPQDRPLPPGPPPERIVAFGTSLTASNPWPDGLAARLTDCLGGPVTVIRVARNGVGTPWALRNIPQVVAARPDLVLIEFVVNDADIRDGVRVARSRAAHETLLTSLRADLPDARLMLLTTPPVTGLARQLQRPRLAAYDAMLRDLAQAQGVALADLAPRWQAARTADPGLRPPDGLHPSDAATAAVTVPALAALIGGDACGL